MKEIFGAVVLAAAVLVAAVLAVEAIAGSFSPSVVIIIISSSRSSLIRETLVAFSYYFVCFSFNFRYYKLRLSYF